MTDKTHLFFGLALSGAVLRPDAVPAWCAAAAGAAVGSVLCDIDMQGGGNRSDRKVILPTALGLTAAAFVADWAAGGALCRAVFFSGDVTRFIGLGLFAALCLAGAISGHRSFMHSLTAAALLSGCVLLAAPPLAPAFAVAYASHLLLDLTNKKGLPLFFPFKRRLCLKWCKADGLADKLVLGLSAAALAALFALTGR